MSDHTFMRALMEGWHRVQNSAPQNSQNCTCATCVGYIGRLLLTSNRENEVNNSSTTSVMWLCNVVKSYKEALAFRGADYVDSKTIVPVDRDTGLTVTTNWRLNRSFYGCPKFSSLSSLFASPKTLDHLFVRTRAKFVAFSATEFSYF